MLSDSNALKASTTQGNKGELESLIEEHDFQKMTTESYQYMLKRMKADLISSQLRSQELKDSFKSKSDILSDESDKQRRAKQERIQAKMKLDKIMMEIEMDQRERQERIQSL